MEQTKIKRYFDKGFWTKDMVQEAVENKKITQTQADEITGGINENTRH